MTETKITVAELIELSRQSFDKKYGTYVPFDLGKSLEEIELSFNELLKPPKRKFIVCIKYFQ